VIGHTPLKAGCLGFWPCHFICLKRKSLGQNARHAYHHFDTLKFVRTLEASGVPAGQAEAIWVAVRDAHTSVEVATKGDLDKLEAKFDAKFSLL
jgi:hypothetical protein